MTLPRGFEEVPGRPDAVGVRAGGPIIWLLVLLGAAGVLGGIPFFFVKAKESARTDTLWPVGLVFVLLGVFCLAIHWLVSRGFKMVIDDESLHSHALIGRFSVDWDKVESIQAGRGALFITAPGGIRSAKGKVTRKKVIRYNTQGLKCGSLAFADYVIARGRNGGSATPQ